MAQQVLRTIGYTPSANEHTVVYVAPSGVSYVEVFSMQLANNTSVDKNVVLRLTRWEQKEHPEPELGPSALYFGDGRVRLNIWEYSAGRFKILKDTLLPGNAALAPLDQSLFLQPNDFIELKPGGDSSPIHSLTMVREYYPADYDLDDPETVTTLDLVAVNESIDGGHY